MGFCGLSEINMMMMMMMMSTERREDTHPTTRLTPRPAVATVATVRCWAESVCYRYIDVDGPRKLMD